MKQQIFTLVPRFNPSLGFVTAQEIQNTTNNNNNNKKQRRNLDSGALRPRVIIRHMFIGWVSLYIVGGYQVLEPCRETLYPSVWCKNEHSAVTAKMNTAL